MRFLAFWLPLRNFIFGKPYFVRRIEHKIMLKHFGLRALLILGFVSLLTTSGCIEITETIHFNRDMNSGKMSVTYDMSKMQSMLSMLAGMDTTAGGKDPAAAMAKSFEEESDTLVGAPGIRNVEFRSDTENLLFTIAFEFDDISALNEAFARIREGGADSRAFKRKCRNKLVYSSGESSPLGDEFNADSSDNSDMNDNNEAGAEAEDDAGDASLEEQMEDNPFMKGLMEDLVYRQVVTFEGREVKRVRGKAKDYVVVEGNSMNLEIPMTELIDNPHPVEYTVKAK